MKTVAMIGSLVCLCMFASGHGIAGEGEAVLHRGLVVPSEVVEISSQVPGIIEKVPVERGDRVKAGQVVAMLKAGLEKAQVDLALARLDFGKRKMLRNEELHQKQLISIHEKDEMETEVRIMEIQLQEAQANLDLRTIYSPVNGVVVERHLGPGEYIGEGSVMTIACVDPLNVEVVVPAALYGTIQEGMKAQVMPDDPPGGSYQGRVVIVDGVIDAASGTFGVRVRLSNPGYRLPAGVNCQVRFFN